MTLEQSQAQCLQDRWNEEDAKRDELERQAKQTFLEQEAEEVFAPIEKYFTHLGKVLGGTGATVAIEPNWEQADDQKLRRKANVSSDKSGQQLALELTVQWPTIYFRGMPYRLLRGTETLIPVITSEVEQFLSSEGWPFHSQFNSGNWSGS